MNESEHFNNILKNDKNSFCFNFFAFNHLILNDDIISKFNQIYIEEFDLTIKFKIYEDKVKNKNGKFTQSRSKSISNLKEVIGQTIKTFLYFHPKTENKKFTECLKLFKTTYNLNCDIELVLGNQIYYQQIICYPKFKVSDPEVELILGHTQAAINNGCLFFAFLTDDT